MHFSTTLAWSEMQIDLSCIWSTIADSISSNKVLKFHLIITLKLKTQQSKCTKSFEELYRLQAYKHTTQSKGKWHHHTHTHTYIYTFIYCCPQTDLFCSIRTHQTGWIPETGIETRLTQTPIQDSTTQPQGSQRQQSKFKQLWITIVIVYIYPLKGFPRAWFTWRALHIR